MSNDFYNHGSFPTTGSAATSASMRAELDSIAAGFDKMPVLTGNANEIIVVNSSGTALTAIASLPATTGGTGITSYTVGDLVYASASTVLSKLADVATGNALISGGVGVAPSWGKIGLTTHVSGTLPAANGGTGQSSYAVGDLVYASTTTALSKLADVATGNALISGGVGVAPSYGKIGLTTHVSGTLPTANGGTNLTSFTADGVMYASSTSALATGSAFTFDGNGVVISVNSTSDALRITQTGTGNALLVEDSTNPDSTPFVIDATGRLMQGITLTTFPTEFAKAELAMTRATDNTAGFIQYARKARGTIGSETAVLSNDDLFSLQMYGYDGAGYIQAAQILAEVDGTPGTNDMPGRLVFSTTADGASTPTERMRIDSTGAVGIGTTSLTGYVLRLGRNIFGATTSYGILNQGTIQPTVTGSGVMQATSVLTAANGGTPYTIANILHYQASQGTFNADSTVTNQYGFTVASNLIGATNNYGFHSAIASGTGRYNFYAAGTASNFFGGNTIVEVTDNTNAALRITQLGTGNALVVEDSTNPDSTPFVVDATGNVVVGYTAPIAGTITPKSQVVGTNTTLSSLGLYSFNATNSSPALELGLSANATIGLHTVVNNNDNLGVFRFSGSDGTNFIRGAQITAQVDGTPGTNDMPGRLVFSTTADGASSVTEAMRIDSAQRVIVQKSSNGATAALTSSAASIAVNFNLANNFTHTTTENTTLANPTNMTAGQYGVIVITQGATPRTMAFGSYWKFSAGTTPSLTATASAVDVLAYYVESATRITARLIADVK
jgi:hypothetical protein